MASEPCMFTVLKGAFRLPAYCGKESKFTLRTDDGRVIAHYCAKHAPANREG
jgi:hypothetical protein